jgi:hypothetical protein
VVICIQFSPNNSELNLKIFKTRFAYVTNYTVETSANFMKIYQVIQKLLVRDTQTDWWFDKPTFIFGKQAKNHVYHYSTLHEAVICDSDGVTGNHMSHR